MNLAKPIDIMRKREEMIAELIEIVSKESNVFEEPPITTIGGYALRAFVPFSRYTRDCDFVLPKAEKWTIDSIAEWFPNHLKVETLEKRETYGYLRLIAPLKLDNRSANLAIDFMEGEIRGRTDEQVITIDKRFITRRRRVSLRIGTRDIKMFVPDYADYFILKVVSGRPSDVRDIAALVWNNGIPKDLETRVEEIVARPVTFREKLIERVVPDISEKRFIESWRGTFITTAFDEKAREDVLRRIRDILE